MIKANPKTYRRVYQGWKVSGYEMQKDGSRKHLVLTMHADNKSQAIFRAKEMWKQAGKTFYVTGARQEWITFGIN